MIIMKKIILHKYRKNATLTTEDMIQLYNQQTRFKEWNKKYNTENSEELINRKKKLDSKVKEIRHLVRLPLSFAE